MGFHWYPSHLSALPELTEVIRGMRVLTICCFRGLQCLCLGQLISTLMHVTGYTFILVFTSRSPSTCPVVDQITDQFLVGIRLPYRNPTGWETQLQNLPQRLKDSEFLRALENLPITTFSRIWFPSIEAIPYHIIPKISMTFWISFGGARNCSIEEKTRKPCFMSAIFWIKSMISFFHEMCIIAVQHFQLLKPTSSIRTGIHCKPGNQQVPFSCSRLCVGMQRHKK